MKSRDEIVVLVADDNRNLADLYTNYLSETYTVKTAYSGEDALNQLDRTVDIVLLDRRMPGLDGDDVLSVIRESNIDCQVALVTSIELDYDSLPLGFDDYLHKPVTENTLYTLVESLRIRRNYSEKLQDYLALVSKRAALQTAKEDDEFTDHPKVRQLDSQIASLREEIDGLLAEFSDEEFRALFASLPSDGNFEMESHGLS